MIVIIISCILLIMMAVIAFIAFQAISRSRNANNTFTQQMSMFRPEVRPEMKIGSSIITQPQTLNNILVNIIPKETKSVPTPVPLVPIPETSLYPFTTHTFTNADVEGIRGPTLQLIRRIYARQRIPWAERFINMNNNDGIQLWTVPQTGVYTIRAVGAGSHNISSIPYGRGRDIQTNVTLQRGNIIRILVGQHGMTSREVINGRVSMGGGGGTFVASENNQPIIVAGGGGGIDPINIENNILNIISNANSTNNGNGRTIRNQSERIWGIGGKNGNGGAGDNFGAGGGGFYTNGENYLRNMGEPGVSFINGGFGGNGGPTTFRSPFGGFGGGGGGSGYSGGGGGGGYSGGGGSGARDRESSVGGGGGGGGSFSREPMVDNGATNIGHGRVIITFVR
jgi:hypothetical protein